MKFQILGSDLLMGQLRKLPKQMRDATAVGQFNAAQETMVVSKARAPYEHGKLEKGAFVDDLRYTPRGSEVEFGYHGVPYLARQHEDLSYSHPGTESRTGDPGRAAQGQPKFLESAINDTTSDAERTIAKAVDYFLRNGSMPRLISRGIGPR